MDLLCIYPTVFTEQMSMIFFCFVFAYLLFFLFISVETWSSLPRVHMLHVQQHHSDSHMLLFKVCVLVSRLLAIKIKARY